MRPNMLMLLSYTVSIESSSFVLLLKSTAKFYGEITTAKIGVENGAEFNGTCKMSDNGSYKVETTIPVDKESEMVY